MKLHARRAGLPGKVLSSDSVPLDSAKLADSAGYPPAIYTLGTSTRTSEEFLDLFREHGIEVGIDVRSFPTSRFPHFIKESIQKALESEGIRYTYLGKELGGFRKDGYLAYMETDSFQRGLEELEEIGKERKTAFFCAERFPWRCHRRWGARKLIEKGWKVIHIIDKGRIWVPRKEGQDLTGNKH